MQDIKASPIAEDVLPEAVLKEKSRFSLVWLIPILAALIGGWLAWKALSEKGPTIRISFKTAEGLEAGKTKLKFKDVEVGTVSAIHLSPGLKGVEVIAEMVPGAEPYLTDKTRFWVVKPRIAGGQVSGLGTLFSGAYVGVDPSSEGQRQRSFVGLEQPPVFTQSEPGRIFKLTASELGSVDVGAPVYYRRIPVGEISSYQLAGSGKGVDVEVFIRAPHDQLVGRNTLFWDAGGLDVTLGADGIKVESVSVISMLIGGISFDNPPVGGRGPDVQEGARFALFPNRAATLERRYTRKKRYMLFFDDSVRGLTKGAPVEFRGIRIGEVLDFRLLYYAEDDSLRIPVLIEIEPERVDIVGTSQQVEALERESRRGAGKMPELVARGLRGQLASGSLLTGALYVDIDFHPDTEPAEMGEFEGYAVLPTVPAPLDAISNNVASIVKKVNSLPIEQIGEDLQQTLAGTRRVANSPELLDAIRSLEKTLEHTASVAARLDAQIAPAVEASMTEARVTISNARKLLSEDSVVVHDLQRALQEIADAARSIRVLADYLERHPDALISGKR